MNDPNQVRKLRMLAVLAVIGILLITGLVWLYNHAYVAVTASGTGSEAFSYEIVNDKGKVVASANDVAEIKKLVSRGEYEIRVRQNDTSYVGAVRSGGFLKTTNVSATLQGEAERRFVGNNPGACMHYVQDTLVSGQCGGKLVDLIYHVPATDKLPTYTSALPEPTLDYASGTEIAQTNAGFVGLTAFREATEGNQPGYYFYSLDSDFAPTKQVYAPFLAITDSFFIKPYKEGFIVYNAALTQVYYMASISAKAERISIVRPSEDQYQAVTIEPGRDVLVAVYAEQEVEGQTNIPQDESGEEQIQTSGSKVVVIATNGQQEFEFDQLIIKAQACGTQKLCVLSAGRKLEVYDISGDKAKRLFGLPDVEDIMSHDGRLLVRASKGIVALDADKQGGHLEFSFGTWQSCGMQPAGTNYLLCVTSPKGGTTALLITPGAKNTISIDKKVLALMDTKEISSVNAYGNFVYVVPDYGTMEYNPVERYDTYNPAKVQQANAAIAAAVSKLGINTPPYKAVSTGF